LSEETNRKREELRWLSGFAVFGSLLALPGLLPVINNLDLDADPSRAGVRFLAFDAGFLLASGSGQPLLRKFGVRPVITAGLCLALACLTSLVFLPPLLLAAAWQLAPIAGLGTAGGLISIASLFALKPWSSRLGARALSRVAEFASAGCVFACVAAGLTYVWGWSRFSPLPICAGSLLCLMFAVSGRRPLTVVEKRPPTADSRVRQHRSIASFLLLSLLFVQLGSEWSVAGWLPLFLIHRIGAEPALAVFVLAFFFLALFLGRILAQTTASRFGARPLVSAGLAFALAGCVILSMSASLTGICLGLAALAFGFAPPYSVVKNVLDESRHFSPAFYGAILTVAVTGAMCAAWLAGYVHQLLGMGAFSLFPAAGSILVLILELLLLFEAHLMGERTPARPDVPSADRRTS
jgi:FHS family glucose/mannose:H+ symporter-like MFS transporter